MNFDPSVGGEIKKTRPAVIVSNNTSNKHLNRVQVIPLTSNTERIYLSEALVNVNGKENKALADQLTTVSKLRLYNLSGTVSEKDMKKINAAVKVQLNLP